jgi:hypothetical protein
VEEATECGNVKMRTIKLSSKFLIEAIQGKATSFASNLPADIQLLDIRFDLCSNQVFAVIRSDSFEDSAELYPIPEFKIAFASASKTALQPAPSIKLEPKPAIVFKPEPAPTKKPQTPPTQTTSNIANEFGPEQRKILSFRVEGENVIVKPTQFLKAEWDDINEVVKSLGGRWVKGDIISYWEIPLNQN